MLKYTVNKELLIEFIKWYWENIDGRPYSISSEEIIKQFIEDKEKN